MNIGHHRNLCFLGLLGVIGNLAAAAALEVRFSHVLDGAQLKVDAPHLWAEAGEELSVTRLSYLIGGVALQREDGEWVELAGQHAWIDAGQNRTVARFERVPEDAYRALRFHVGLDADTNAADPARFGARHALNPALNGLHWSWQGGYVFLAFEGLRTAGEVRPSGFSYHLARSPNRVAVTLPVRVQRNDSTATVSVEFDVARLLRSGDGEFLATLGTTTHSAEGDPVSAAMVARLPGAFRAQPVSDELRFSGSASRPGTDGPRFMPAQFTPHRFQMGALFPVPDLPRDNPLIEERVSLGRALFHDVQLSRGGSISCASCHDAARAFSDARRVSTGVDGRTGLRNAMPLFNLAWKREFFWDGRAASLREQALMPVQDHAEMDESLDRVVGKVQSAGGDYPARFEAGFGSGEITAEKIGLALESFLLTLTSHDSRFDRALRGAAELSAAERRGFELFMTEYDPRTGRHGADCFHCHGGPLFTDHQFRNNGLDLVASDAGRFAVTGREADRGRFATPSLRNIALTAPYMHDGRFATLEQVVEHYSEGVRPAANLDANLAKHPDGGVPLTPEDKAALVAFLRSLTDEKLAGSRPIASIPATPYPP